MKSRSEQMPFLFFWTFGLAAGTFLFYVASRYEEASLLADSQIFMNAVRVGQSSGFPLFRYIFQRRFLIALALWLASMTQFAMPVLNSAVFCYGVTTAYTVSALTYLYGVIGYPMALAAGFPHNLIYIPVWMLFYFFCRSMKQEASGLLRQSPYFLALCLLFLAASFLEAYINPWILEWAGYIFRIL